MTAFFYSNVPEYCMKRLCAVRDTYDNLWNILTIAEIVNTHAHCKTDGEAIDFDFVIFSGEYNRALVKKHDGYFSMTIPFQIIDHGDHISFNSDQIEDEVNGLFIQIMRNALSTSRCSGFCFDEVALSIVEDFNLTTEESLRYSDLFVSLLADDHGYFRFDDDAINENGDFHPRYHFDFFYKNSSAVKIGCDGAVDIQHFYALFDSSYPKKYLRT